MTFGPRLLSDPLCRVVLVEPLIPENTGNISRTCVATGSELHLVEPMGFELNEKRVKRAGLDYWPDLGWRTHASFEKWRESVLESARESARDPRRVFAIETTGTRSIYEAKFQRGDWIVFGKETSGLSREQIASLDERIDDREHHTGGWYIPMPGTTRSLNLSNAVAVCVFELLRQVAPR